MKARRFLCCVLTCLTGVISLQAQPSAPDVRLVGLVQFSTNQLAIFEDGSAPIWRANRIMKLGERDGDLEVVEIDVAAGKAKIRHRGKDLELTFPGELPADAWVPPSPASAPGSQGLLRLQQAPTEAVFALYQRLAHCSLIRPQALQSFRLDLGCRNAETGDLLDAIGRELEKKGILLKPDGSKFTLAGKAPDLERITPDLKQLAEVLAGSLQASDKGAEEMVPSGAINFPATDLEQVLMIYQELVNRTLLRPAALPAGTVVFRSYTSLSRAEAIYALSATLAINGLSVVPAGSQLLFIVPTAEVKRLDSLLSRRPGHSGPVGDSRPAGTINLRRGSVQQVAALYQDLSGRPVEVEPDLPQLLFVMRSQTPLSGAEALHALDLLLGYYGLVVAPSGDNKTLKIGRSQEVK